MKIKTTTQIYLLQSLLILAFIIIMVIWRLATENRQKLFIQSSAHFNHRIVDQVFTMDAEVFSRPLRDNSEWDNTIDYVKNPTREFEEECFNTLLPTFSINHIWVFDPAGKQIYYVGDTTGVALDTIFSPGTVVRILTQNAPFCHFFIKANNRIYEIFGATIVSTLDVKHISPPQGFLIFAKTWNEEVLNHLKELTGATVSLKTTLKDDLPEKSITGLVFERVLQDFDDKVIARVVFNMSTPYLKEWKEDTRIITIAIILTGVVFLMAIVFLLQIWVASPLKQIIRALNKEDLAPLRILEGRHNEFGEIARLIKSSFRIREELKAEVENRKIAEHVALKMRDAAEESDRLKTAFLSNISHEIRTPMNGILGYAQLLEGEGWSDTERKEFIAIILKSGSNLLNIINDIIDFSAIESGQVSLTPTPLELKQLFFALRKKYEKEIKQAGKTKISLELEFDTDLALLKPILDGARLAQIINNLLSNAVKFTEKGFIRFGVRLNADMLIFFVQDTGKGIDEAYHHIIFERFRQENDSITRQYGGLGLGVPISKKLVELMGGRMWVNSEVNIGSTFFFRLPLILS
jgi:signal transduction histidine kinase